MADQAEALRQLVLQAGIPADRRTGRVLLVVGAQPSVGGTTISGYLAVALRRQGWPTALVDADLDDPSLLQQWGLTARHSLAELASRKRTVREVVQAGPGGLQLVGGCPRTDDAVRSAHAGTALADALRRLARQHWVVIDGGRGEVWEDLYDLADVMLVVTTSDGGSLRAAYARLKSVAERHTGARIWSVVNQVHDVALAQRAQQKLTLAADRFLNLELCSGGLLPKERQWAETDLPIRPHLLPSPNCRFIHKLERLTVRLMGEDCERWPRIGEKSEKTQSAPSSQPITSRSLLAPGGVKM